MSPTPRTHRNQETDVGLAPIFMNPGDGWCICRSHPYDIRPFWIRLDQFRRNPGGSGDDLAWVHRVASTKTERTNTTTLKEALWQILHNQATNLAEGSMGGPYPVLLHVLLSCCLPQPLVSSHFSQFYISFMQVSCLSLPLRTLASWPGASLILSTQSLMVQNNNYFVLLTNSMNQKLRQGRAGMGFLCSAMPEISAGKTQIARRDSNLEQCCPIEISCKSCT